MILLFFCSITFVAEAEPPTIVKGDVYIDNIITEPEEVHLTFPDQSRIGTTYADGRYIIMLIGVETGSTGYFDVIYSGQTYSISEPIILEQGQYIYTIDLYIKTAGNQDPDPPDPGPSDPVDTNDLPKADAGGPYYEIVNIPVQFDGSDSYDPDGTIAKYEWDFKDGSKSTDMSPSHTYKFTGKYQVKLTVTDNEGLTDLSNTFVYITATPNLPPTNLTISGPTSGTIQTNYEYTIQATDLDDDNLQYTIQWGDVTESTSTFLQNGTSFTTNHSYNEPGIYKILATVMDENNAYSEAVQLTVLIDAIYCGKIGYMIDYTNDGVYDLFHSNTTDIETIVENSDNYYFIDINNDGEWNYIYDMEILVLEAIPTEVAIEETYEEETFFSITTILIIVGILLAVVLPTTLVLVLTYGRGNQGRSMYFRERKQKKEKKDIKKTKQMKEREKEIVAPSKDNDVKSIEDEIDSLFSKKK